MDGNTSRRDFLRKGDAGFFLSALSGGLATNASARNQDDQLPCNGDSPILRELWRIADSCDGRTVRNMVVDLLTDPEFIGLPTYFLNTQADTLSAFQKDLLNSYIKISADPALLRQALTDPDLFRPETRAHR